MTSTDLGIPELGGLASVPAAEEKQTAKEYKSDQEVRWCPGCGDYIVLNAVQSFLPSLGLKRENIVFISGIGCSSRFPYYMNTYGMHSIHGRAPTIATGLATTRPDLSVWVVTGDGDALSIGGNHLIHALRRNVNLKILLFNNRIYGLTKGQYSPTSEVGKVTKSTPAGSLDHPFTPVSLALGAEASFVARTLDSDRNHVTETLRAAAEHRGSAVVEIYQNCPIFNDGAFDDYKGPEAAERIVRLVDGEPILLGADRSKGVVRDPVNGSLTVTEVAQVGMDHVVVHDATRPDPSLAFELAHLHDSGQISQIPLGILRSVSLPTYDDMVRDQLRLAGGSADDKPARDAALQQLLRGNDTWQVHN